MRLLHIARAVMMDYVTVSIRIPRRLKEQLDKYGIKLGPIVRRALEEEVRRRMLEEIRERASELSKRVSHIPDEEIARLIREDREG